MASSDVPPPTTTPEPLKPGSILNHAKQDVPAGIVVFLVAVPLCLGIALASGVPLLSGLVAGAVGGLIIPLISRSALSVSGPAAGLTAIVLAGVATLGQVELFFAAVVVAGVLQLVLGALQAGGLAALVPSSVIRGMLAAIGIILLMKQIPHVVGHDESDMGLEYQGFEVYEQLLHVFEKVEWGAFLVAIVSLTILYGWPKTPFAKVSFFPAALAVVVVATGMNQLFLMVAPEIALGPSHLVSLPLLSGPAELFSTLPRPEIAMFFRSDVFVVAITLAAVASIETLLSLEAVDRIDPWRRRSPKDRELFAQGVANVASGFLGGLPVTSVIVRSSANVTAGGRDRLSSIVHGALIVIAVLFGAELLNMIPLAALAAILIQTGLKLASPSLFKSMFKFGPAQFWPFIVTVLAVLSTDLLRGVALGLVLGIIAVLRENGKDVFKVERDGNNVVIEFEKDITFLAKGKLRAILDTIQPGTTLTLRRNREFIDFDIREQIMELMQEAPRLGITVILDDIDLSAPSKTTSLDPRQLLTLIKGRTSTT
jgi:MFS superfamily sulfate permease-like transporter